MRARQRLLGLALVTSVAIGACSIDRVTPSPLPLASPTPAPTPDQLAPSIVSQDPLQDGTTGTLGRLVVTFNEPVGGVDAARFQLHDASGAVLPATIVADQDGRHVRLTPSAPLTVAASYTATLAGAIRDDAGNLLAPISWTVHASDAIAFLPGAYTGYQFDGGVRHPVALQRTRIADSVRGTAAEYQIFEGQGFLLIGSGPLEGFWVHGTAVGEAQDDVNAPITPLPACDYVDLPAARTDAADWMTSLLDTVYRLPAGYRAPDLVDTANAGLNKGYLVRRIVISDLSAMLEAAKADGIRLSVLSAFRSYGAQVATFANWVERFGYSAALLASARPGHSEHQLGTAIDFASVDGPSPFSVVDWATTRAGAWMKANAWRFGWVLSYPKGKQSVSCYQYEPWHYRYFGRDAARAIREAGITEREWLWRQGFGIR